MDDRPAPVNPGEAERRFAARLEEAGLPRFTSAVHDPDLDLLQVSWENEVTFCLALAQRDDVEPIDEHERAVILGLAPCCEDRAPIHVYVPGSGNDPRADTPVPGIVTHRGPALHPDDVTTIDGIPVTSPSRTPLDLAEVMTADELRACFARARDIGLLDPEALRAARARVEWRPSLPMFDEVTADFLEDR